MSFGLIMENQNVTNVTKFYYNDTESFVLNINTDYIFKDIAEDDETRFDTSNYELHRSLPKENIKS